MSGLLISPSKEARVASWSFFLFLNIQPTPSTTDSQISFSGLSLSSFQLNTLRSFMIGFAYPDSWPSLAAASVQSLLYVPKACATGQLYDTTVERSLWIRKRVKGRRFHWFFLSPKHRGTAFIWVISYPVLYLNASFPLKKRSPFGRLFNCLIA